MVCGIKPFPLWFNPIKMIITAELSLYPNSDDYIEKVTAFCMQLKHIPNTEVKVGVLSTVVTGEASTLWPALMELTSAVWEQQQAVLHIKMARGALSVEQLPDSLQ